MTEPTRFDLEQSILEAWKITSDLELVRKRLLDHPEPLSEDELDNIILGLINVYNLRFESLFAQFEQLVKKGRIT